MPLPPYRVSAFNTAKASENKIHDDATAQRFGFRGGFVGGVNVYAYMSHQPVQRWGRAWLERGTGEARFTRPVYEGDIAEISATEDPDGLALTVHSQGVLCASGRAAMPVSAESRPYLRDYRQVPPRAGRVAASETSDPQRHSAGMDPHGQHGAQPWPGSRRRYAEPAGTGHPEL
jgi:hypothetical protein